MGSRKEPQPDQGGTPVKLYQSTLIIIIITAWTSTMTRARHLPLLLREIQRLGCGQQQAELYHPSFSLCLKGFQLTLSTPGASICPETNPSLQPATNLKPADPFTCTAVVYSKGQHGLHSECAAKQDSSELLRGLTEQQPRFGFSVEFMFPSEYNNNITSVITVVASRSDMLPGISIQHTNSDYSVDRPLGVKDNGTVFHLRTGTKKNKKSTKDVNVNHKINSPLCDPAQKPPDPPLTAPSKEPSEWYAPTRCAAAQESTEQGLLPPCHHHEAVHDPQLVPCTCPLFSCPWEGHLEVVVSHLRQTHRINILQGAEIVFLATDMHLPAPTDWIIMHSCLGHQFLLVLRKQEKHEGHPQFFATMMLIGTPSQANNFTYRLELNRNQRRLKWEATPRSVLERVDSVISDGDCLVLNTSLAQLFSDNGSLAIGIAITTSKVHSSEAEMSSQPMAEPEMANVLWGQGQRQPHDTAGSPGGEHSEEAQCSKAVEQHKAATGCCYGETVGVSKEGVDESRAKQPGLRSRCCRSVQRQWDHSKDQGTEADVSPGRDLAPEAATCPLTSGCEPLHILLAQLISALLPCCPHKIGFDFSQRCSSGENYRVDIILKGLLTHSIPQHLQMGGVRMLVCCGPRGQLVPEKAQGAAHSKREQQGTLGWNLFTMTQMMRCPGSPFGEAQKGSSPTSPQGLPGAGCLRHQHYDSSSRQAGVPLPVCQAVENLKRLEEEYVASKEAFKLQRVQDYIEQTNLALFKTKTTRRTSRNLVCDAEPEEASSSLPAKQAKIAIKFPERPLKKEEILTAPATYSPTAQPTGPVPKESRLCLILAISEAASRPASPFRLAQLLHLQTSGFQRTFEGLLNHSQIYELTELNLEKDQENVAVSFILLDKGWCQQQHIRVQVLGVAGLLGREQAQGSPCLEMLLDGWVPMSQGPFALMGPLSMADQSTGQMADCPPVPMYIIITPLELLQNSTDMLVLHPSHSSQVLQPDTEEILSSTKPSLTCHESLLTSQDHMLPISASHMPAAGSPPSWAGCCNTPSTCTFRAVLSLPQLTACDGSQSDQQGYTPNTQCLEAHGFHIAAEELEIWELVVPSVTNQLALALSQRHLDWCRGDGKEQPGHREQGQSKRGNTRSHISPMKHLQETMAAILTLTGLNRINSVSLLDKYKDMLRKVDGNFVFIVLHLALLSSEHLSTAEKKRTLCIMCCKSLQKDILRGFWHRSCQQNRQRLGRQAAQVLNGKLLTKHHKLWSDNFLRIRMCSSTIKQPKASVREPAIRTRK
ncbi:hypothetical protein IHE44_0005360 [Lamprotornis superbus]|uniref:E3 ubiquitin-protein ligase n=1 Tax=Lamprotornis superbus TaxID=245042 RepID=A0A835NKP1_9PASS|nr:hypothetical protein IHE44_0005360 [Lamprotornis superbus]